MGVGAGPVTARAGREPGGVRAPSLKGAASATSGGGSEGDGQNRWLARLESPLAAYYLVLGSTVALVVIGLVMVLSSSSVESLRETKLHSSYTFFTKQALFAGIGTPLAWIASRIPPTGWRRLSWVLLAGATGLLAMVPFIGVEINGNQNWIVVAGVTVQPSELAKFALLVWAATVLSAKEPLLHSVPHTLVPVVPVAALLLLLVLVGNDLGTAMVLMAVVFGVLFVAGAPLRAFALTAGGGLVAVAMLVAVSPNRMSRISSWLTGTGTGNDYLSLGWQSAHGTFALATGGWWGVGLGASKEKWFWLPEAHNDFIFAIIGEELGLPGTLAVLGLFAMLAIGLTRLVQVTDDLFVKIATGGVLLWVVGQAVVNIGAVVGMLPVVGVPLPLVSSGGSALLTTMVALGMVFGFARRVPGAPEALTARAGVVRRSLAVLPHRAVPTRHRSAPRGGPR
ncbi:MAG TPA: putative lipid II flippase FtsW [Kineosporiaceae bacterium]